MSLAKTSWLAVLPLFIIWVVANLVMTGHVESQLAARAGTAVGTAIEQPSLRIAGRDATLGGVAYTAQGAEAAVNAVRETPGVRLVESAISLVPVARPYGFESRRDGDRLILSGNVPDPAVRAKLLQAAKVSAPGITVVDELTYARGAPDGFEAIATYGLSEAGKLADSRISLVDGAYSIAGRASTAAIYRAALAATRQLPANATIATVAITSDEISPYVFTATKRDGALKLTGSYPDEQAHQKLLAAAQRRFFNAKVTDGLASGKGAPKGFLEAASAMLQQLSRLEAGVGTVSDTEISVTGDALYAKAAADIPAGLSAAAPAGYKAQATIGVAAAGPPLAAEACQPAFADVLAQGKILFEIGRASIQHESDAVLDNLTSIAMRCPEAKIEVSGHTDSVGNDDTNMELSRRRAEAVAD